MPPNRLYSQQPTKPTDEPFHPWPSSHEPPPIADPHPGHDHTETTTPQPHTSAKPTDPHQPQAPQARDLASHPATLFLPVQTPSSCDRVYPAHPHHQDDSDPAGYSPSRPQSLSAVSDTARTPAAPSSFLRGYSTESGPDIHLARLHLQR